MTPAWNAALQNAHIPSLLMSLVHLTGNTACLKSLPRPVYDFFGDGQGGLDAAAQAQVRAAVAAALADHAARGHPELLRPTPGMIQEMMDYIAGVDVPSAYHAFLVDEIALDGAHARLAPAAIAASAADRAAFPVIVIGAGMSGLLAAIQLKSAGLPFTIIERGSDVGGTWAQNTYPGCRVDTPNHLYSYSFEPNHGWPQHYSTQDVLLRYFQDVADKYELRPHIKFNTQVSQARYDETSAQWHVAVRNADGTSDTLVARAVISAVGQLNQPSLPDIPGRDSFAGPAFHSARWDAGVDLKGKRVCVIGTGASAFQFVPEIARDVAQLTVFQRSAPWLGPTPDYHFDVTPGKKLLLAKLPFYANWYRFWLFWMLTDGVLPAVQVDPEWTGDPRSISAVNDELRTMLEQWVTEQTLDDPDLRAKVIPNYPPGGKRMLRDNGQWVATLKLPNVALNDKAISSITPTGVLMASGDEIPADVIIFGTGFKASEFLMPMQIIGRDGINLHDHWQGDARAYLGITVPGFPNFFSIYGPNTNIVVNGSIIFFSECAAHYIVSCIARLVDGHAASMEVRADVHDAFNARVDAGNALMSWGTPGASSWYKNARGRVSQNWPFALVDYWNATRTPDLSEFILTP